MSAGQAGVPLRHEGGFAVSGWGGNQEHRVAILERIAGGLKSGARQRASGPGSGIELAFDDERLDWIVRHDPRPPRGCYCLRLLAARQRPETLSSH